MGNLVKCRKCGKSIMFVKMKSGKSMPVDPQILNYNLGGKERIVTPGGDVVAGTITDDPANCDGYGYISHYATCKYANMFRKKKKSKKREVNMSEACADQNDIWLPEMRENGSGITNEKEKCSLNDYENSDMRRWVNTNFGNIVDKTIDKTKIEKATREKITTFCY